MANSQKSTIYALVEETTAGTPVVPTSGSQFIPLKSGVSINATFEELANDEIVNDLGESKSLTGKETPSGTHGVYLKHSETEGQAPEYGVMIESLLGAKSEAAAEYDTVVGSTTTVINVDTGEGATFEVGEALLIKDGANGYSIANVASISGDQLTLNFALGSAPASGVNLGQAILYKPAVAGHPTFTGWMYRANGAAIEAVAGCRTSSMSISVTAAQQLEAEFSYEGTSYYFNPVVISASNKYLDVTDDGGTFEVTLTEGVYKDPVELAAHVQAAGQAAATASGGDDFLCAYNSQTGKFTISTTTGATLSLLWDSGTNAANSVGATLGFDVAADDTGSLSYEGDNAIDLSATGANNIVNQTALTASYDEATNVVAKSGELFIGDATDNFCRKASNITISLDSPSVDADSICAESGLFEKVPASRSVTMTATLILDKYESHLFNKFLNNTTTQVMLNLGAKSGGNWVPGKCVNVYFGNAVVNGHNLGGDEFVTVDVSVKGFITQSKKDIYLNFI